MTALAEELVAFNLEQGAQASLFAKVAAAAGEIVGQRAVDCHVRLIIDNGVMRDGKLDQHVILHGVGEGGMASLLLTGDSRDGGTGCELRTMTAAPTYPPVQERTWIQAEGDGLRQLTSVGIDGEDHRIIADQPTELDAAVTGMLGDLMNWSRPIEQHPLDWGVVGNGVNRDSLLCRSDRLVPVVGRLLSVVGNTLASQEIDTGQFASSHVLRMDIGSSGRVYANGSRDDQALKLIVGDQSRNTEGSFDFRFYTTFVPPYKLDPPGESSFVRCISSVSGEQDGRQHTVLHHLGQKGTDAWLMRREQPGIDPPEEIGSGIADVETVIGLAEEVLQLASVYDV